MSAAELTFDTYVARELAGDLGSHVRWVSETLGVDIAQRGGTLRIDTGHPAHELAVSLFTVLGRLAADGRRIHPTDVRDGLRILQQDPGVVLRDERREDARVEPDARRLNGDKAHRPPCGEHDACP